MKLLCLTPIRNGEPFMDFFLSNISKFAEGLIVLDDGSNDRTVEILQAHSLVKEIIRNPVRDTYYGWDDLANRNVLLDCAAKYHPEWILFLDVDELIDENDIHLFTHSNLDELNKDHAYGFRLYRMVNDLEHYDKSALWVYRMFAYRQGQQIVAGRLHFEPIPGDISMENWKQSSARIKHLSSLTEVFRSKRYGKYQEADPNLEFQASYENLLDEPKNIKKWEFNRNKSFILSEP
ncbi:MAG TPA: glycosyltransferase family 2 protein [Chitinophagaceae bacterium]|nr:glycosyltransferase family 2 protein [Chitinophagaceae bacterium]